MNVLFFTYYYPPIPAPRSIQIGRLAKYSRCAITVVCADETRAGDATIPAGSPALVQRLAAYSPNTLRGALDCLPLMPDRFLSWCQRAGSEILRQDLLAGQEALVTFGQPMSVHMAGLRIKRATGIPWLVHFSDPWADSPYRFRLPLARWLNRLLEARVVAAADRILFTCQETRHLVMAKYPPAVAAKAAVLPHAYDPDLFPRTNGEKGGNARLVVRHVGAFYRQRTPDTFLEALMRLGRQRPQALDELSVEFVGRMHSRLNLEAVQAALPPGVLSFRSRVDYATSLRLMRQADLLLLIDAPFARNVFLPSKLIDYLGAGRPILALTPPGATAEFVGRLGGMVVAPTDPARVAAALEEALALARRRPPAIPFGDPQMRQEYRAEAVASRFDGLLQELVGEQREKKRCAA